MASRAAFVIGDVSQLESLLGHRFSDHGALKQALTHSSVQPKDGRHYERLEFVGDRVLGLCIAEWLYETFPEASEGELSVRLNSLVSGETCAAIADGLHLHRYILAGSDVANLQGKRMRSVRADVVESLIAALYLDGGLDAARAFIKKHWAERIVQTGAATQDSKTALQEWAHQASRHTPRYSLVHRSGPDHAPTFVVAVDIEGMAGERATGRSKRAAEQAAAEALLVREGIWERMDDGSVRDTRR